ncbi:MAG: type III-A CRISPR-associated protein Cas10/Csm1 [Anaerolineae bacterium]|nr:type III-A CRISPR-associated protein Cas10/Csm1 [Anaerolineae bacterium]
MAENRIRAAMAGLLHDIGKLAQRASDDPTRPPGDTREEGQPVHAAYSIRWIEQELLKKNDLYRQFALPGAYHHRPSVYVGADTALVWAVALADKLSAGERDDRERKNQELVPRQMLTIFDSLSLAGENQRSQHYLPLAPLALSAKSIFPEEPCSPEESRRQYRQLLESLAQGFTALSSGAAAALEQMMSLLQRHTWCVPSSYYYNRPDISLYDHSRMTAALAVCLSEMPEAGLKATHQAVVELFKLDGKMDKLPAPAQDVLNKDAVMLIGGDISGIQDFIYTIGSKNAAKTLRGRSFYLQLLTEAVLRFVLRELDLPYTNVIYSGGGHFFLLAPLSAYDQLPALRRKVSERLLAAHGVKLYLALDGVAVPFSGFRVGAFPEHWGRMHTRIAEAKNHRFSELGDDLYQKVFAPKPHGGNQEHTCRVCGVEDEHGYSNKEQDDTGEPFFLCSLCDSFDAEIGKDLPGSDLIALALGNDVPLGDKITASTILASFGMQIEFLKRGTEKINIDDADRVILWALDDPKDGKFPTHAVIPSVPWLHYTVNQVPKMTFDALQKKSKGIERLGVLRMDVDNLGSIFQEGFGKGDQSRATLSRLATLSFQLSLFFEGWLKRLIESENHLDGSAPLIYAVYTGGDDLFLIGPWDNMPALAQEIAASFDQYTGGNPGLHLSGGLAFIHGKYPVHAAAEDAGDLEKQAKDAGRNRIAFLGEVWTWMEFSSLVDKKEKLVQIVGNETNGGLGGSHSLLQRLQELDHKQTEASRSRKDGKAIWGPWMWLADYQLVRMADQVKKKSPALHTALVNLREDLHQTNPPYAELHIWAKGARWAQLELRKKKHHDDESE